MKYDKLADEILSNIGGKNNVDSLTFCTTRLRFKLIEDSLMDSEKLKSIDGVLAVVIQGGQTQVVIGQHVKEVYEPLSKLLHSDTQVDFEQDSGQSVSDIHQATTGLLSADDKKKEMKSKKSSLFDIVSGMFTPLLGLLSGSGILKGLLVFLVGIGALSTESGTYIIIDSIVTTFFTFLPVFLGYTSMKKFGGTGLYGMAIGLAFVAPTFSLIISNGAIGTLFAGTVFEMSTHTNFLSLPVTIVNYHSTVFPVIMTTWLASHIESFLTKYTPNMLKFFVIPGLTLLISSLLGILLIGPIATVLGNGLAAIMLAIYNFSPTLSGFLYGLFLQYLVVFGLHWGFIAVSINNLATLGFDAITVPGMSSVFGQAGVILYIFLKTRNIKLKQVSLSGFISAIFGITEPGIYGVTLQHKRGFFLASLASGIAGGIMGYGGVKLYAYGPGGVFSPLQVIPASGIDSTLTVTIISCVVAFVLSFILMHFFGKYSDKDMEV